MVPNYVETILRSILVNLALLWPFGKRKMNFLSWKNTYFYPFFGVWVNFLTLSLCHTPTNYIFLESTEKILLESIIKSWISLNHSATEFCHPICHESWLIPWNPTYTYKLSYASLWVRQLTLFICCPLQLNNLNLIFYVNNHLAI